ncbi:MAG: agmatinase family protein [Myxococcales bacterium]|jgi:agmatinase|nr:agmatinase family protein [Myxococcales bacterium]
MTTTGFDPNAPASPDSGIFGLTDAVEDAAVVLVPVPFDATTSYRRGAALGPVAILKASHQVDLFDLDLGRIYEGGIALLERAPDDEVRLNDWNARARELAAPIIEAGGAFTPAAEAALDEIDAICGALNEQVESEVSALLSQGKLVGIIGGDHATPFGAIAAHAARFEGMGLLHIDAHADLREAFEGFTWSHASIMFNAMARLPNVSKLVQVGLRDFCEEEFERIQASDGRIEAHFDVALARELSKGTSWTALCERIVARLPRDVYVSLDIDGLDPALCPNTGTPVPGGLSFNQLQRLLEVLVESGRRIVGFDLTEVAPSPDDEHGDEWDANVGARALYKLIGWARQSQMK